MAFSVNWIASLLPSRGGANRLRPAVVHFKVSDDCEHYGDSFFLDFYYTLKHWTPSEKEPESKHLVLSEGHRKSDDMAAPGDCPVHETSAFRDKVSGHNKAAIHGRLMIRNISQPQTCWPLTRTRMPSLVAAAFELHAGPTIMFVPANEMSVTESLSASAITQPLALTSSVNMQGQAPEMVPFGMRTVCIAVNDLLSESKDTRL
jgi:hypothetical protein